MPEFKCDNNTTIRADEKTISITPSGAWDLQLVAVLNGDPVLCKGLALAVCPDLAARIDGLESQVAKRLKDREVSFSLCYPDANKMTREQLLEALRNEVADVQMLSESCSKVFCHVTGGHASKPATLPEVIINLADDEMDRVCKLETKDIREHAASLEAELTAIRSTNLRLTADLASVRERAEGAERAYRELSAAVWTEPVDESSDPMEDHEASIMEAKRSNDARVGLEKELEDLKAKGTT